MQNYNRAAEDVGNIIALEHVNVLIPDQAPATLFYVAGLGLTRDPYLMTTITNMWVNAGRSQFHLPRGKAQKLRGRTGLVVPDLKQLQMRLKRVAPQLKGTKFSFTVGRGYVDATCPWGNRIRCHAPGPKFGNMQLGMPYIEFDVPVGTAQDIARFYREILETPTRMVRNGGMPSAKISAGHDQYLLFTETKGRAAKYDGHHFQIYITDFSGPHRRLLERGLVTEESDQFQYRFEDIIDLDSGKVLFKIEHEVRSMTHPLYARPLVNRNPNQTNRVFAPGYETAQWAQPFEA